MPVFFKIFVISSLFLVGLLVYFSLSGGFVYPVSYFIGSIWFLSFISSSPLVYKVFNLGDLFYGQELS